MNVPCIASNSAVATVLYSPSDTPSRKKMILLGGILFESIKALRACSIIFCNDSMISTRGRCISVRALYWVAALSQE